MPITPIPLPKSVLVTLRKDTPEKEAELKVCSECGDSFPDKEMLDRHKSIVHAMPNVSQALTKPQESSIRSATSGTPTPERLPQ